MAKKVDHVKAKAARQKKIAIGLGVVLLAVAGFQGPKTLKMLKGPAAPVAAPAATTAAVPETTVPPSASPAPTPVVGAPGTAQPAVLVSSDAPPAPQAGQLLSFEMFQGRDPFVQQAVVETPGANASDAANGDGEPDTAANVPAPSVPADAEPASAPEVPAAEEDDAPQSFATAPDPATKTTISVNGNVEEVVEGKTFPSDDPVFVFVSIAEDGRSVQIGIAGGEYADGKDTISLKLGKVLTLQNTADGSRYELKLETVAGFAPPAAKKK
jgi:hypothetical protein